MKTILVVIAATSVAAAGFLAGIAYRAPRAEASAPKERRILYYVDPMHPAYKSDKPGTAPDRGMKLEPVYEGDANAELDFGHSGMLNISAERQQLIGVEYGQAEWASSSSGFRASGKVAQHGTRVIRLHPQGQGWNEQAFGEFIGAPAE